MIQTNPMTITGEYCSPDDGTVIYTSAVTLTANFPFTVDDNNSYIVSIRVKNSSGIWSVPYVNGYLGINITSASNVITISGAGTTPFLNTDLQYVVLIKYQQKAYDKGQDVTKVVVTNLTNNPEPIPLISSAYTLTSSFADVGFEFGTNGTRFCCLWIKITAQTSTGIQLQVLGKHTASGTEEYNLPISVIGSSLINVSPEIVQFPNANGLYRVSIDLFEATPYIQVQFKHTAVGATAGTIDTLYYTTSSINC